MVILYILLIAYILAVNFYAFLLVKSLRDKEREAELKRESAPLVEPAHSAESARSVNSAPLGEPAHSVNSVPSAPQEKYVGKLCITGALGGAITIYVCMFLFKFRRSDLLLMVLMPLLGVLNVYLWVILFRSGFSFFVTP